MPYNPNFQWKRKTVTVTAGTALTAGHQVKLTIPKETEMQTDFRDLRFETTDGYGLPHWLETIVSNTATVWVKLKNAVNAAATVDIYMYYGNPYVASTSNGTNTFKFFDDFADGDYTNNPTWTVIAGTWSAAAGYLAAGSGSPEITVPQTTAYGVWEWKFMRDGTTADHSHTNFIRDNSGNNYNLLYNNSSGWGTIGFWFATPTTSELLWAQSLTTNQWYDIKVTRDSSGVFNFYIDGVWKATKTHNTYTTSTILRLQEGGPDANWDLFRIRQYTATEPSTPTISGTATTVSWNPQRKKITINTTTATPVNYQVKLTIPFAPEMNNDFSDLRFVTKTGVVLDYWLESSVPGVTADVWIELADAIGTSSSDYIYMHYGNPYMTSVSNGSIVSSDFTKYTEVDPGSKITVTSTKVNVIAETTGASTVYQTVASIGDFISTFEVYISAAPATSLFFPFMFGTGYSNPATENWGSNNGVGFEIASGGTPTSYITKFVNGTRTIGTLISTGLNTLYYYTIKRSGTTLTLSIYTDSARTSHVSGSPQTLTVVNTAWTILNIALNDTYPSQNSHSYYVQNLIFRKYIATEPTIDQTAAAEPMNTSSNRKKLTINNNSGGALTDYQVPITVTYEAAMQADFDDIRFVDANGNLLPCWLESKTNSVTASFWIKVNLPNYGASPTGDNIVYMYYGNAEATSTSNGDNTFKFFDDFSILDVVKWNIIGNWSVSNGILTTVSTTNRTDTMVPSNSNISNVSNTVIEMLVKSNSVATTGTGNIFLAPQGVNSQYFNDDSWPNDGIGGLVYFGNVSKREVIARNVWWRFKLVNDGSTMSAYRDDAFKYSDTSASLLNANFQFGHGVSAAIKKDQSWDWIRIRKYASPEPTYTTGAEETPYVGFIPSPFNILSMAGD